MADETRKVAFICSKGDLDMAYPALVMGWAALGNGIDVTIFFTFWGLDMINKHRQARLEIAPVANTRLTVVIAQDATGGRAITWSADFRGAAVEIDTAPNTVSIFQFAARSDGKWWLASEPVLGVPGSPVTPGIYAGGGMHLLEQTLTTASTQINAPTTSPAANSRLALYLTQDASGGRAITWGPEFVGAAVEIDTAPNAVTVFQFIARADNKWWLSSLPVLGVS